MRLLLLAVVLAAATAVPAAGEDPPAASSDEASLPPLLVRWPLAPRQRSAAPAAPGGAGPGLSDPRLEPVPETSVQRPGPPGPRPLEPSLEPEAAAGIPEREGPSAEPEGMSRTPETAQARPPEVIAAGDGDRKQPGLAEQGRPTGSETSIDIGVPLVPPARLALALGSFEIQPPTEALKRWTFPEGSGLSWSSLESSREGDWVVLTGAVDVRVGSDRIQGDVVRLNERTQTLEAEGNVVLDHLDSRLAGERMEYDLATNKGTVWNAIGFAPNDITFTGERVEKVGDNKYIVYSGSFTSCTQPLPIWQVKVSKAIVDVDNFVYLFNPRVLFKKVPASWFPWAAIPIKQERATGFMIPKISSSSTRGLSISEDFFWAINRSVDVTFGGEWWDKYGWSNSNTARWHLNGMSNPGRFQTIYLKTNDEEVYNGRILESERWYASVEHDQEIWGDWKLTVKGEIGNDRLIGQDGSVDPDRLGTASPIFNQRVTLQRRWGKHSLAINLENDERETESAAGAPLDTGGTKTTTRSSRRLPEVEYRMSSMQIAGKTWAALQMEGALGYLHASEPIDYEGTDGGVPVRFGGATYEHDWFVADVYPQLRFPMSTPFLDIVPSFNLRATWWSRQQTETTESVPIYDPDGIPNSNDEFKLSTQPGLDSSLFAWAWDAGVRIGGPDFQRIYRKAVEPGKKKWQHLIEPEIDFRYTPSIDSEFIVAQDRRRSHYSGRFDKTGAKASVSLINTLRNKTVVPVGERSEAARDWLIWRLSADYNFRERARTVTFVEDPSTVPPLSREEHSYWSDITSDVNFRPSDNLRFSLRNTYDILLDDVVSTSLTGGVEGGWGYFDMAYTSRRDSRTLESQTNELSVTGEHWFYKDDRIRLGYDLTRSFEGPVEATGNQRARSAWPYKRFIASYYNQCCGVSLSWEDIDDRSVEREREWTFIVSLKDVGNFLRLRRRSQSN